MQKLFVLSPKFLIPLILLGWSVSFWSLFTQSIRLDEAQSIWMFSKPVESIISLTSADVHVPLYGFLLHFWMQIFGNSIIAARSLSMLFFFATIPVMYQFIKEASNKTLALLSVTFFSLSPFIMWYSAEARMYTLFTFATSLCHLFFLRMIASDGNKGKFGYFVSLILGFYTHYFFIFLVITQAMYTMLAAFYRRKKQQSLTFVGKTYAVMTLASLCFLPWIILFIRAGAGATEQPLIPPPTSFNIIQTFVTFLFGFQAQGLQAVLVSLWPIAVMGLFFVFTRRSRVLISGMPYLVLVSFLPIILVFLISYFRPIYLTRYLIVVTPSLFFLIAWSLIQYSKKITSWFILTTMFAMLGLMAYQTISATTPVRENYAGVSAFLQKEATPRDIIALSAPFTLYPIEYTYTGTTRITTIPEWDRYETGAIPPFSLTKLKEQMTQDKKQYDRLFLVLSYDQGYEKDIRKYFDSYELIASKTMSPKLEIRVYKLRYDK